MLTTHAQLVEWGPKILPKTLAGKILVVDEAHHVSVDEERINTQIGQFASTWYERGGTVIFTTATPFRADRKPVLPEGTKRFLWTITNHAREGFAPNKFEIRTARLSSGLAETTAQLSGDDLSDKEEAAGNTYTQMVDQWAEDGCPHAFFVVPSRGSRKWADRLLQELSSCQLEDSKTGKMRPVRVVDAVGPNKETQKRLTDALQHERKIKKATASKADVIIVCKRADEGTDWPLCSHLYNYGIPSSFGLIQQRWGRTFRWKGHIEDFPDDHKDVACITFFIPRMKEGLLERFENEHHDHAFLLACYMEDYELARKISHDSKSPLSQQLDRIRKGKTGTEEERELQAIDQEQEAQVMEAARVHARSLLSKWQLAMEESGETPNLGQAQAYLDAMTLSDEERLAAEQLLFELLTVEEPEELNDAFDKALKKFERRKKGRILIREEYQQAFREATAPYRKQTFTIAGPVVATYSNFTGQDAADVTSRLREKVEKPDLTEEMIIEAAKKFHEEHGRWPTANG